MYIFFESITVSMKNSFDIVSPKGCQIVHKMYSIVINPHTMAAYFETHQLQFLKVKNGLQPCRQQL